MSQIGIHSRQHHPEAVADLAGLRLDIWPGQSSVAGSTPAVPPIVIKSPTFAIWLYGPIGSGVFEGELVSTSGMALVLL